VIWSSRRDQTLYVSFDVYDAAPDPADRRSRRIAVSMSLFNQKGAKAFEAGPLRATELASTRPNAGPVYLPAQRDRRDRPQVRVSAATAGGAVGGTARCPRGRSNSARRSAATVSQLGQVHLAEHGLVARVLADGVELRKESQVEDHAVPSFDRLVQAVEYLRGFAQAGMD